MTEAQPGVAAATPATRHDTLIAWGLFLLALLILWPFYSTRDFSGMDIRFAYFVQEMLRTGITLYPHTQIGPFPDYPATSTWVLYALSLIGGGFNLAIATLPSAATSAATVAVTWRIGALHSRQYGLVAALLLLGTFEFLVQARMLSIDVWVMLFTTLAFYIAIKAILRDAALPIATLLLLVLLSTLFRSAIGGVITTGVVCCVCLINQRWREMLIFGCLATLVLVANVIWLAAAAYLEGGDAFLAQALSFQGGGRFEARKPALDAYLVNALGAYAIGYPLALAAIVCVLSRGKVRITPAHMLLFSVIVWLLVVIGGLSIPGTKKTRYILPAAPAMALLAGALFTQVGDYLFPRARRIALVFVGSIPLLAASAALLVYPHDITDTLDMHTPLLWALALCALFTVVSGLSLRKLTGARQVNALLLCCTATVLVIKILVMEPAMARHASDRPFVDAIEAQRTMLGDSQLGFYRMSREYEDMNYLVLRNSAERPVYYYKTKNLASYDGQMPLLLIMRTEALAEFERDYTGQWQQIAVGRLAHKDCVALVLHSLPGTAAAPEAVLDHNQGGASR